MEIGTGVLSVHKTRLYNVLKLELPEKDREFQADRMCGWKPVPTTGWAGCEGLGSFGMDGWGWSTALEAGKTSEVPERNLVLREEQRVAVKVVREVAAGMEVGQMGAACYYYQKETL